MIKDIIKERERLQVLKEAEDYESLLEWYYYERSTSSKEQTNDQLEEDYQPLGDEILSYFTSRISNIEHFLYGEKVKNKIHVIELLKDIDNPNALRLLLNKVRDDDDGYIINRVTDVICAAESLIEVKKDVFELFHQLSGKKIKFLSKILYSIEDQYFIETVLNSFQTKCPRTSETCAIDIRPQKSFFVGHKFSKKKIDDLRPFINIAVKSVFADYVPYYADDWLKPDQYCKICEKIQSSRFGIFDISEDCNACHEANQNVMLELGMVLGFGKRCVIIIDKVSNIPSDLKWADLIIYESYTDLENQLKSKLPDAIKIL